MTAELIAAVSAVLVALIAAFAPTVGTRDGRKKALDEAELLVKLKESLGDDAAPVEDLKAVLAHRTDGWKEGVDMSVYGWFLRWGMILAALTLSSAITVDALTGQDLRSQLLGLLHLVQWVSALLMAMFFLIFGGATVAATILSIRRWLNDRALRTPGNKADDLPVITEAKRA